MIPFKIPYEQLLDLRVRFLWLCVGGWMWTIQSLLIIANVWLLPTTMQVYEVPNDAPLSYQSHAIEISYLGTFLWVIRVRRRQSKMERVEGPFDCDARSTWIESRIRPESGNPSRTQSDPHVSAAISSDSLQNLTTCLSISSLRESWLTCNKPGKILGLPWARETD